MEIIEEKKLDKALEVFNQSFNGEKEILTLVSDMFSDETAEPLFSILATDKNRYVGCVLFSNVKVSDANISASILCPLGVIPDYQNQGVGKEIVEYGLKKIGKAGVQIVFVLGYPDYYAKFGFKTAMDLGFYAPYNISIQNREAWMVKILDDNLIIDNNKEKKVKCANSLSKPEYWM